MPIADYSLNPTRSDLAAQVQGAALALASCPANAEGSGREPSTLIKINEHLNVLVSTVEYPDINAECREIESTPSCSFFEIAVDAGFVASINWFAASIWTNPLFQQQLGDCSKLLPPYEPPTEIPPGLELVWWAAHYSYHDGPLPPLEPTWLQPRLKALCDSRLRHLQATIHASLQFILLHEIAHCALRHEKHLRAWESDRATAEVRRIFEMQADRWASVRLLQSRYETEELVDRIPLWELLGMTVVYTLEHAQRFLRDEQAISDPSRYPPLWFRMEDSFAVNSWVSGRRSTGLPEGQVRADRYRQEGRISSVLMEVGNTHPLIVEWLGPAIDGSRTSTYQSILCDSRKLLSQLDIPSGND